LTDQTLKYIADGCHGLKYFYFHLRYIVKLLNRPISLISPIVLHLCPG